MLSPTGHGASDGVFHHIGEYCAHAVDDDKMGETRAAPVLYGTHGMVAVTHNAIH